MSDIERKVSYWIEIADYDFEIAYPTDREKLMRSMNRERSISILDQTKELYAWIETKL